VLLEGKNAVIYGGGGTIGGAVARADAQAVDEHADAVAAQAGSLDVSLNVIAHGDVQGTPMVEMELADYVRPVVTAVSTTFLTARAAARHMIPQGSGVILAFGGSGDPLRGYNLGGLQVAFEAIESMRKQLSSELGRHGIRFVTLRSGGVPETIPDPDDSMRKVIQDLEDMTMLGRAATLEDVGHAAAFAASDRARTMTPRPST
jgi:3-oxoacyl-[acyl-carrier protein] reductase